MLSEKTSKLLIVKPAYLAWPVGFAYVLACLQLNNIPFDFIDASRSQNLRKDIKNKLSNNDYFAVATGGLIGMSPFFKEISLMVHKYGHGIPFILGGNVTKDAFNDLLFKYIGMDFGVLGEAETSLPYLINSIIKGEDVTQIPGIIYKNGGHVIRNPSKRLDLGDYILPAWERFDVGYYIDNSSSPFIGNNLRFMPILTGRGCVGRCTFCSPSIGGFRKRPMGHVLSEVTYLSTHYDFDKFMFYNEMFYPTSSEIKDFCNRYMLLENRKPWIAQVRIDANIDVETFSWMKKAGCIVVSSGIESGSDKVLSLMNKKTTSEQIKKFFINARIANMPVNGTFIVGSEGETETELKKTIDLVIEHEVNSGESLMYTYPGTSVYENALKKGLIKDAMSHLIKAGKNTTNLFTKNIKDAYLNISDIPENKFLDVITKEVRRYNTFVFNRYPVQGLSCKFETHGKEVLMSMSGKCRECGFEVTNAYHVFDKIGYVGLLGLGIDGRYICPRCFHQLSFNIYTSKDMQGLSEHLLFLKEKISVHNRIIIGGVNADALFMLRIDLLGIDYKDIHGFLDFKNHSRNRYFVNYPILNLADIVNLNPGCILMIDSLSEGEQLIRKIYHKKDLQPPEFLYLFDKQVLRLLSKIYTEGNYQSLRNQFIIFLKDKYSDLKEFCDSREIRVPDFIYDLGHYFKRKIYSNKI